MGTAAASTEHPIFTIGHSNHTTERFIELLRLHGVDGVADVRSSPHSRYLPHFNAGVIKPALNAAGIDYVFMGGQLGGRPDDPSCYDDDGRVIYAKLADTDPYDAGIQRIIRAADDRRIALMCSEKDPLECHRALLLAQTLARRRVPVLHINADGSALTHDALMDALVKKHERKLERKRQFPLFPPDASAPANDGVPRSRDDMIAKAIDIESKRIAFVNDKITAPPDDWDDAQSDRWPDARPPDDYYDAHDDRYPDPDDRYPDPDAP